jgi:small subunit ribosomal protein S21
MAKVERRSGESLESLLKRFRRQVTQDGQLRDYRRKRFHVSKSEIRREKVRKGIRRMRRKTRRQQKRRREGS